MPPDNNHEYFSERARRERELSLAAADPRAAAAHAALADVYEALVANDRRPTARILTPKFGKRPGVNRDELRGADVQEGEG